MRNLIVLFCMLLISACTTPKTILKNEKTGQVATCGGNVSSSIAGGAVGYHIQKSNDTECIIDYLEQGFVKVRTEDTEASSK